MKVWCHISTPCTAGCGLGHLHMKNESFLPKWREQIAQHIQGWNRIARLFARHCDNPRLLLTREWPESKLSSSCTATKAYEERVPSGALLL